MLENLKTAAAVAVLRELLLRLVLSFRGLSSSLYSNLVCLQACTILLPDARTKEDMETGCVRFHLSMDGFHAEYPSVSVPLG